jgi:hypothetical protein
MMMIIELKHLWEGIVFAEFQAMLQHLPAEHVENHFKYEGVSST